MGASLAHLEIRNYNITKMQQSYYHSSIDLEGVGPFEKAKKKQSFQDVITKNKWDKGDKILQVISIPLVMEPKCYYISESGDEINIEENIKIKIGANDLQSGTLIENIAIDDRIYLNPEFENTFHAFTFFNFNLSKKECYHYVLLKHISDSHDDFIKNNNTIDKVMDDIDKIKSKILLNDNKTDQWNINDDICGLVIYQKHKKEISTKTYKINILIDSAELTKSVVDNIEDIITEITIKDQNSNNIIYKKSDIKFFEFDREEN